MTSPWQKIIKDQVAPITAWRKIKNKLACPQDWPLRWWLFIGASLLIIFVFLLVKPILVSSWLKYPLPLKGEIAWSAWQTSFETTCLRQCLEERVFYSEIIVAAWQANPEFWSTRVSEFMASSASLEAKKALIALSVKTALKGELPLVWQVLLAESGLNPVLKSQIIRSFSSYFASDYQLFRDLTIDVASANLSLEERLLALESLVVFPSRQGLDFLLALLFSAEGPKLKREAINILALWPVEKIQLAPEDVNYFSELALDPHSGLELRPPLVWLLSSWYPWWPELISEQLLAIYQAEELDPFSRGFAADTLNRVSQAGLALPVVSETEWEIYYSVH